MTAEKVKEGGYGWVILLFAFLSQTIQMGITWSSGVFYVMFLKTLNSDPTTLALISALNTSVFFLTGPIAAFFTNRYGCRVVHIVGGLTGCGGLILCAFATDVYVLSISFGIITGFGLGCCFIPSINIVNLYFNDRRTLAMGLAVTGGGLGTLIFPALIRILYDTYGYQGAVVITAGVGLNLVVSGAAFRPVKGMSYLEKEANLKNSLVMEPKKKSFMKHLNLDIFKSPSFLLLSFNNFFIMMGSSVVHVHLGAYAGTLGHPETASAMLYSGFGISNLLSRLLFSLVGLSPKIKPVVFYTGVCFFGAACMFVVPLLQAYWTLMTFAVGYGLYIAIFCVTLPLFIVEILSPEMLTSAYGYILVFEAVGQVIGGPFASLLYKATGYYGSSMLLGGGVTLMSALCMIYPCWVHTKRKGLPSSITVEVEQGEEHQNFIKDRK